jgi:hypothetical protein
MSFPPGLRFVEFDALRWCHIVGVCKARDFRKVES